MVDFYASVFQAEFQSVEAYGAMLFRGNIAGLDMLLYPQELAGIHTDQNRFLPTMSVDFLARIGELVGQALSVHEA